MLWTLQTWVRNKPSGTDQRKAVSVNENAGE